MSVPGHLGAPPEISSLGRRALRRCALFVSALNLSDLPAAFGSGADMVCVDLEDAVPPQQKDNARAALAAQLRTLFVPDTVQLIVRINSLRSLCGLKDVQMLLAESTPLRGFLMPKVESAEEVRWAAALADEARCDMDLHVIIETPQAVEHCGSIAVAHEKLRAIFFGGFDLSTALGSESLWEPLLFARSKVVQAAATATLDVLDSPFQNLADHDGLRAAAARAKSLGMTGKTTKALAQVAAIQSVFSPTPEELFRAQKILQLFDEDPAKPLIYEGKLIELPTIKRIRRIAAGDQIS
jgi:(S)-citramalyl-CoA lyase